MRQLIPYPVMAQPRRTINAILGLVMALLSLTLAYE